MNLDINEVLEQAKQSIADKEYEIWLLKVQVKKLQEQLLEKEVVE